MQLLLDNYATLNCLSVIKDGPWRWLVSISTQQLSPVLTPGKGEIMKVGRDPRVTSWSTKSSSRAVLTRIYNLLRFHEFSASFWRQGHNVVLKDKSMQGSKWVLYLHTCVCIHTFFRNWVCKRYVFASKVCKIASTAMFPVDWKPKCLLVPNSLQSITMQAYSFFLLLCEFKVKSWDIIFDISIERYVF